jgi:hypothetical protein
MIFKGGYQRIQFTENWEFGNVLSYKLTRDDHSQGKALTSSPVEGSQKALYLFRNSTQDDPKVLKYWYHPSISKRPIEFFW